MTGRTPRVTLSGYYGFGNAGDEAVLSGLVHSLRAGHRSLDICALSINPAETEKTYSIRAAHRYQAAPLLRAIARTDLLLSGGGSLLQDVTSAHGIFYYLAVVRLAQMLGKKTMFIAQGIGPLLRPRSRKLVASVANKLDALTVRDEGSALLLREIGVTKTPIEVTADPALLLSPPPQTAREMFAVSLRPWGEDNTFAATVAQACQQTLGGARALLIPMQPQLDAPLTEQFAADSHQQCERQAALPLPALLGALASCQMVVGMRLHALILAAACGVPSVALSYDPKVAAFMEQSGQGDAVYDIQTDAADQLTALLARVWAERVSRAATLQARLPSLQTKAAHNAEVALTLLAGA